MSPIRWADRICPGRPAGGPDVLGPRPGGGRPDRGDLTVERMAQAAGMNSEWAARPIDPRVVTGHVHLRTSDIDRPRGFYVDLLSIDDCES